MFASVNRTDLIVYLKRHRLWLHKTSGQHFLIDRGVLEKIVAAAELASTDRVLEIGPGIGTLTAALAETVPQGLVLAVEKDYRFVELLRREFKSRKNVKIVHADGLQYLQEIKTRLTQFSSSSTSEEVSLPRRQAGVHLGGDPGEPRKSCNNLKSKIKITNQNAKLPTKLVANLPYNITGPILRTLFDPAIPNTQYAILVLMLQKEVVDRLLAPPGSSARGILTILRELYGPAEKIVDVAKTAFFPVPAVDSAVVKMTYKTYRPDMAYTDRVAIVWKRGNTSEVEEERSDGISSEVKGRIVWLAKLGFAAKRQMLVNALAAGLRRPKDEVRALLKAAQIEPRSRAEDLSLDDWRRLADVMTT